METGDIKSLKKGVMAFCVFGGIIWLVSFGSYYLGMYGFTIAPFAHQHNDLWWKMYDHACKSLGGAMAAGVSTYLGARQKSKMIEDEPAA